MSVVTETNQAAQNAVPQNAAELLLTCGSELCARANEYLVPFWQRAAHERYHLLAEGWPYGRGAQNWEELTEYRMLQQRNAYAAERLAASGGHSSLYEITQMCSVYAMQWDECIGELTEIICNLRDRGLHYKVSYDYDYERDFASKLYLSPN